MSYANPNALATTNWLASHLRDDNVRVVDGTFCLPNSGRDPRNEFKECHIPNARFFDIDAIAETETTLPHMLPTPEVFAEAVGALGIGSDDFVVVYDAPGSGSASRVWWTFRVFGHNAVAVLDGGLSKWIADGQPIASGDQPINPRPFTASFHPDLVASKSDMMKFVSDGRRQIVDNRSSERHFGRSPEPRPVERLGHIPNSINIPFSSFQNPLANNMWRSRKGLETVFAHAGVDPTQPMASYCGSGVTAASTAFAAFLLGHDDVAVYDGSWAEWGNSPETPIVT
jgi:thiosulfate/3-mercaptopyruvate sulfurtransferase